MDKKEEEEEEEKKRHMLKNNFTERKHFIRHYQRNGWMDFSELWILYTMKVLIL